MAKKKIGIDSKEEMERAYDVFEEPETAFFQNKTDIESWFENGLITEVKYSELTEYNNDLFQKKSSVSDNKDITDNVQAPGQKTTALSVKKDDTEIDLYEAKFVKQAMKHKNNITIEYGKIDRSIFKIAFELHWLYDTKGYVPLGYDNIYELARVEFNIARGTTNGYINMVNKFGERDELDNFTGKIAKKYVAYSASKLIAMLDLTDEELELFKPTMSVREIKKSVAELTDKNGNENDSGSEEEEETGSSGSPDNDSVKEEKRSKSKNSPASDATTDHPKDDAEKKEISPKDGTEKKEAIQIENRYYKELTFIWGKSRYGKKKDRFIKTLDQFFEEHPFSKIVVGYAD